jgi:hypothetical protein
MQPWAQDVDLPAGGGLLVRVQLVGAEKADPGR